LFLAGRIEACLRELVAQAKRTVFGDLRKSFTQFFVGEVFSFFEEVRKVLEESLDCFYVSGIAIYRNVLSSGVDAHRE